MTTTGKTYRLLTRSDFDGLVCAILLKQKGMLGSIQFAHPKDVQDGRIAVSGDDILTNLPYVPGCHLCFDHHGSESIRNADIRSANYILEPAADSAARVLYQYYGGQAGFPDIRQDMMMAVDKADAAKFTLEDILYPQGWELLSFLMDARTGLGRFREFRVSNFQLMMDLIDACTQHSIEEILRLPDVEERVLLYRDHHDAFVDQILRCTTVHGALAILDLRDEETIYAGNRFMIYALFPQCEVSMHILPGLRRQNTVFAMGRSIFNRRSKVDIGELMLRYGGGGHEAAGTCQVENALAEQVRWEIVRSMRGEPCDSLVRERETQELPQLLG